MRITVKVGTSTLTYPTGMLNIRHVEALCKILKMPGTRLYWCLPVLSAWAWASSG